MKKVFNILCIIGILFVFFYATFSICITHTEKVKASLKEEIEMLKTENDKLRQEFIDYQLNNSIDTVVLSILPQHINFKFNTKK